MHVVSKLSPRFEMVGFTIEPDAWEHGGQIKIKGGGWWASVRVWRKQFTHTHTYHTLIHSAHSAHSAAHSSRFAVRN